MTESGEDWKAFAESCAAHAFSIERDGLVRLVALCDQHAADMQRFADRAKVELYVNTLGIGESELESARTLTAKFQDKAIGGGSIAHESSAVGVFEAHRDWARAMGDSFRAALRRYEEQDAVNAAGYGQWGDSL
ncbi:hypothetical protein G4H71_15350 [Rhodococcus triatomae]|uniref:Uncharacterized protein n=1 Tax=Rhodococcus triatomae TaxID=300028 RepID=A0A1G8J0B1_9NOCA|nr:hypothetical protein [Rhodococcus triatomae]QNG19859.1 hypothetical protein G4H72_15020 [Rhodococcus triatomae]QNG24225.1 hypothetical protein G4H71_15350 [Rhodococcus triatomae]SDI24397.1 hypothetical protein SAMN05444695_10616 [Rhodococcus triatomae]